MLARSLLDEHDKGSNLLGIVTSSVFEKKIDMPDKCYEYVRLENVPISNRNKCCFVTQIFGHCNTQIV